WSSPPSHPCGTSARRASKRAWRSGGSAGASGSWRGASCTSTVTARIPPGPWWAPVVLGLGPLIRPDLAVFSVAFVAVHVLLSRGGRAPRGRAIALAVALPLAFELFRMAYFANLVPNTALTKEAGAANVAKGMAYLDNLLSPYYLWVPLVLVFVWGASWLTNVAVEGVRRRQLHLLLLAPVAAGVAHGAYIVRVGGDFMHGRLLLPAIAGVLLPFAVLPVSRARLG